MSQDEQRQSGGEDLEVEEGRICGMYVVFSFKISFFERHCLNENLQQIL